MYRSREGRRRQGVRQDWRWLMLVALATLSFADSPSHERLRDDTHHVFDNPTLADRQRGLERVWRGEFVMDYYPVTQGVLWIEYGSFGGAVPPYRVANLLLHAAGVTGGDAAAMRSLRRLAADHPNLRVLGQDIAILVRIIPEERGGL
jgi:hypothetical protein